MKCPDCKIEYFAELYVSKEKYIHQILHTFLKENSEGYNF